MYGIVSRVMLCSHKCKEWLQKQAGDIGLVIANFPENVLSLINLFGLNNIYQLG